MKPVSKNQPKTLSAILALMCCSLTANDVRAQYEQAWKDNVTVAPMRDSAVQPADFQSPSVDSSFADTMMPDNRFSEEPAKDTLTANSDGPESPILNLDEPGSWISGVEQQFADVDFVRVLGSLAIVLGGYFGFVWFTRKLNPSSSQGLPKEVVEVLGQTPFGPKKTLQLVRLGSKLLLLMNGSEGTQSVGEITDPHEVEYLASLCGGKKHSQSAIAIRKASSANQSVDQPATGSDLKRILRQLQQSGDSPITGSVFDA